MKLINTYEAYKKEAREMHNEYERLKTPSSLLNFVRAEARLNGFVTALQHIKLTKETTLIIDDYRSGNIFN
ncbi:hypothetical protein I6G82_23760 [Lysinibacillus macroides]|uniref:Uncharacterized protein n=1 Tax=Lysinibacillus macroides TaxID=33935 RepID=A0A0M9DKJ7_9BACI|nr:hypothetical protein [Lysinibacillus macroides]KOY82296.1 hypothetical protein ADM90_11745 [Lysinibacillus macroides]QPR68118.1 hypothetical protein I6G82_23760 [Lysinibacillus macroides]